MDGRQDIPPDNPSGITERFEIEKVLSAGKSTLTYKAQDTVLNEEVTVKTMSPDMVKSEYLQLFHNDLRSVSKVEHDSIAKILDYGQTRSGKPYVVLEYLEGVCLKDLLKQTPELPLQTVISIIKHLSMALSLVHQTGAIHQDIKPSNIFLVPLDEEEIPVIVDFGFGQLRKENEKGIVPSSKGTFAGDPMYMSPEQIEGETVDQFTDYYSLGCLFFELINGEPPFAGNSAEETFSLHLNEPVPELKIATENQSIQLQIEELIASLLQKDKKARNIPLREVHSILSQIELQEYKKPEKKQSATKPKSSFSLLGLVGSTIVFSVLLLAVTTYLSHNHSQKRQFHDKPVSSSGTNAGALIDHYIENRNEKHLKIRFINISDSDVAKIKELAHLETLQIGGSKITKSGLSELLELEFLEQVKIFNPTLVGQADLDELNAQAEKPLFVMVKQ